MKEVNFWGFKDKTKDVGEATVEFGKAVIGTLIGLAVLGALLGGLKGAK